jgi:hypothetical protein
MIKIWLLYRQEVALQGFMTLHPKGICMLRNSHLTVFMQLLPYTSVMFENIKKATRNNIVFQDSQVTYYLYI